MLRPQHPVDLAEHAVDVVDGHETPDRQRGVDGVGTDERQLGQWGVVDLQADLLSVAGRSRFGHLVGRLVDADHLGSLPGEGDRVVAGAAAEVEDPLAVDVAQKP